MPAGDATAGKVVFDKTCVTCHGADGKGRAGLGKDLVTSEFVKSKSDAELVAFIAAGRPASDPANTTGVDMPANGGNSSLTEQDLANVVAYVRTLK
jgi:mono/diheme cytochrome c family protein